RSRAGSRSRCPRSNSRRSPARSEPSSKRRSMVVRDPSGTSWEVTRRVFRRPGWSRLRRSDALDDGVSVAPDAAIAGLDAGLTGLVVGVVVVVVTLLIVVVWPLVLLLAELVVALVVVGFRLAVGRWTVVAESPHERLSWQVKGGRRANALVRDVAN